MNAPATLQSLDFDVPKLMSECPPVWRHEHKRAVYQHVRRETGELTGTLHYTRWAMPSSLGEVKLHGTEVIAQSGFYTYSNSSPSTWHVNFADPRLFIAYGSALLAQDELQALEHPTLGSLREALLDRELPALTRENSHSTPVLVMNVPRLCAFDVLGEHLDTGKGAPGGWWTKLVGGWSKPGDNVPANRSLYGNAFQDASLEEVLERTMVLRPPTLTNFIAIAAPLGGKGIYTRKQLKDVLETASCGFNAALLESRHRDANHHPVEIHTGWWGCGAFGGNRVVMAALQVLAARIAGVDRLVFYFGPEYERCQLDRACALLDELLGETSSDAMQVIGALERRGFTWGVSDGN